MKVLYINSIINCDAFRCQKHPRQSMRLGARMINHVLAKATISLNLAESIKNVVYNKQMVMEKQIKVQQLIDVFCVCRLH